MGVQVIGTLSTETFSNAGMETFGSLEQKTREPFGISRFNFVKRASCVLSSKHILLKKIILASLYLKEGFKNEASNNFTPAKGMDT